MLRKTINKIKDFINYTILRKSYNFLEDEEIKLKTHELSDLKHDLRKQPFLDHLNHTYDLGLNEEKNKRFIESINRQYDGSFAQSGAKIGTQLRKRLFDASF